MLRNHPLKGDQTKNSSMSLTCCVICVLFVFDVYFTACTFLHGYICKSMTLSYLCGIHNCLLMICQHIKCKNSYFHCHGGMPCL